ncbi:MAG: hypothetical protein QOD10_748, partial [Mycobacterium sp.]|nr:hypothetical protein [Mycobacterium sp.]
MERMSQAPEKQLSEAGTPAGSPDDPAEQPSGGFRWSRSLQATPTRRALLLAALGGLLIAGLVTAIPVAGTGPGRLTGYLYGNP